MVIGHHGGGSVCVVGVRGGGGGGEVCQVGWWDVAGCCGGIPWHLYLNILLIKLYIYIYIYIYIYMYIHFCRPLLTLLAVLIYKCVLPESLPFSHLMDANLTYLQQRERHLVTSYIKNITGCRF